MVQRLHQLAKGTDNTHTWREFLTEVVNFGNIFSRLCFLEDEKTWKEVQMTIFIVNVF